MKWKAMQNKLKIQDNFFAYFNIFYMESLLGNLFMMY